MDEPRKGRQTPTQSIVLPYEKTYGNEAIDIYNTTGKKAQEWQERVKSYKPCKLRLVGFFLVIFRRLTGRYPYLVYFMAKKNLENCAKTS